MRRIPTLPLSTLLACGPLVPPGEAGSATTTDAPSPTTTEPTTTTPTTITAPTTIDISTTSTSTGEADFTSTPDVGTSTVQCDVFAQDCPPGKKCAAWAEGAGKAWNATKCVTVLGHDAPGEPCTTLGGGNSGIDSCVFAAMCWDVDETNHGICRALCTGTIDAPICGLGFSCAISGDSILNLCLPGCDPLLQDCPGDGLCIANADMFLCAFDASGDEGQLNDPCEFANSCDKGLACLPTATASAACPQDAEFCCQPFCTFPDAPCPNPDQQCIQWYDPMMPIPPGLESVGICKLPE